MNKPEPHPLIAAYIAEVSVPGVPWVSTPHLTLRGLYNQYGQSRIVMLINEHWANMREYAVSLKREHAENLVAACNGHPPLRRH